MGLKVTNNAFGTLNAGITNSATTIVLTAGQGARFPTLSAGDYFYATLIDTSNNLEIVKVTARSTDTMTVVRGQDNTTARAYSTNDRFELRPTAALFNEKANDADVTTSLATKVNKAGDTMTGKLVNTGGLDLPNGHIGFNRNITDGSIYSSASHAFQISFYTNSHPTPNCLAVETYSGSGNSLGNAIEVHAAIGRAVRFPGQPGFRTGSYTFDGSSGIASAFATSSSNTGGQTFIYRNSGHFNTTTGVFTAPIAGKYLICGTYTSNDGVNNRNIGWLYINGTNIGEWVESYGPYDNATGVTIETLQVGDTVQFARHPGIPYEGVVANIDFLG